MTYQPTEDERRVIEWLRINRGALQFIADDLASAIERGGHRNDQLSHDRRG